MTFRKILLTTGALAAFLAPTSAWAVFNISTPGIREGKLDAELRNRWDYDDESASQDGYRNHVVKLEYGFTKRFSLELQTKAEKRHLRAYELNALELESKFRFYEPGDYWLDSAVKFAFEKSFVERVPDKAKTKLLLEKNIDKWNMVANFNFTKEVGTDATKDTAFDFGWRTKYKLNKYVEPGIEMYNNWGEISRTGDFETQKHRIGPMIYGELVPGVKYQFGYLFGFSDAAEDGSLKLFLKYEIPL